VLGAIISLLVHVYTETLPQSLIGAMSTIVWLQGLRPAITRKGLGRSPIEPTSLISIPFPFPSFLCP